MTQGFLPLAAPGQKYCCQCGRTENSDGSLVTWRCQVCNQNVCRHCTLLDTKRIPPEYYHTTLCSEECRTIAKTEDLMVFGDPTGFEED
jgi:hypothetical protein